MFCAKVLLAFTDIFIICMGFCIRDIIYVNGVTHVLYTTYGREAVMGVNGVGGGTGRFNTWNFNELMNGTAGRQMPKKPMTIPSRR